MSYNLQDEINKAQIQSGAEIEKASTDADLIINNPKEVDVDTL